MLGNFINVLLSGGALGMLLFLMACGLSITMGLMGFANMAHTSFAMLGGYVATALIDDWNWPFLAAIPAAAAAAAISGVVVERALFRHLYNSGELEQVLLTIGLVFMSVAAATYVWGPVPRPIHLPAFLDGQVKFAVIDISMYRLFLILVGTVLIGGLFLGIYWTTFGAKIRAAVDNRRMTTSCGVNVDLLFSLCFALGTGLAGLGGALSVNLLGLDPFFPLRYLVLLLLVVVVGGMGSIRGTLLAALILGIGDVMGKYYVHQMGAFFIYAIPVAILLLRPQGLLRR